MAKRLWRFGILLIIKQDGRIYFMRALVQRVSHASVTIDGVVHGKIGQGFLVLLGITDGDTEDEAVYLADKTVKMRVFTDENDKMNR